MYNGRACKCRTGENSDYFGANGRQVFEGSGKN